MRVREKALSSACLPLGAAAGYAYLVRVLRPVSPAVACLMVRVGSWRCTSYQIMVTKPFFVIAGALIGIWLAYALVRLRTTPGWPGFTRCEGLLTAPPLLVITAWVVALHPGVSWDWGDGFGWWQVLLFLLAGVLIRFAIGIASIANMRGGLILAFGLPLIFAGLGYAFVTLFRLPAVGHSCPAFAGESRRALAYACTYHPLTGTSGPWVLLGLLGGLWLAYAVAVVLPIMVALIWWALVIGPDQAGGGYADRFVFGVCLTALLRLVLGAGGMQKALPGVLARLGMARSIATAPPP
jgi:hypothetical protein